MPLMRDDILGNYRVDSLLGSGGMGHVYRAVHVHLRQPVAIKVLHPQFAADPDFRARFLKEAQATAALVHQNIVRVTDFGEQTGTLYLVMELVNHGTLRTLLSERAGGREEAPLKPLLELMKQAADGLAFAHAQGQVHADVKPDNMLLSVDGNGNRTLKICDFGLVRLVNSGMRTVVNTIPGTPPYMSPEQVQELPLDGRSDLYSLGIVLYEVTTGMLPFQANTLTSAVHAHVFMQPLPPRQTKADIPADVEDIVLRCLAKNPNERFASAADLSAALGVALGRFNPRPDPATIASGFFARPVPTTVPAPLKPVQIAVEKHDLVLTPGQPSSLRVDVINSGPVVEHVYVEVDGAPKEWIRGQGRENRLQLNPGARGSISLNVSPPRLPSSRAGEYKVSLRAKSDEERQVAEPEQLSWTVTPFYGASIEIEPAIAKSRKKTVYAVKLANHGNVASQFTLSGKDDQGNLSLQFENGSATQSNVRIEPGDTSSHNLAVSPALRWFGSAVTRNFAVEAAQAESSERKSAVGRLVHQALLPGWALAAAILLLLAVGWLIFRTLQPVIGDHFVLDPPNPGPNQSVTVTLQIQHASSVIITPPSDPTGVPGVYRIPQGFVTPDLKVSASNMFGTVDKTFHVNLAPSKRPDILAFTALPSQISKGDTITVSWKTQNADEVTIAPIGPVETSGSLTQTLDESTTFDLIAKNGGGQRTEQQQVKVDGNPAPPAQPQPTPPTQPAPQPQPKVGGGAVGGVIGGLAGGPHFAGTWEQINPIDPQRTRTLQITQSGDQAMIGAQVYAITGNRAVFTSTRSCPGSTGNDIEETRTLIVPPPGSVGPETLTEVLVTKVNRLCGTAFGRFNSGISNKIPPPRTQTNQFRRVQ